MQGSGIRQALKAKIRLNKLVVRPCTETQMFIAVPNGHTQRRVEKHTTTTEKQDAIINWQWG